MFTHIYCWVIEFPLNDGAAGGQKKKREKHIMSNSQKDFFLSAFNKISSLI